MGDPLAVPSSASFRADGVSRRVSLAVLLFKLSWEFAEAEVGGIMVVAVLGVGVEVGIRVRL